MPWAQVVPSRLQVAGALVTIPLPPVLVKLPGATTLVAAAGRALHLLHAMFQDDYECETDRKDEKRIRDAARCPVSTL